MALNYQTSTLSLTLPISCQICLGKVRQPVICANYHVFCSSCMEVWLKKAGQCPTCRVPITAESPCREIIGGTNEGDHNDNPSMRKCLRKTRGELLLREYEEEIEGLMRENEELKIKTQSLETQLKTALHPTSINTVQPDEKRVPHVVVEEWKNKLQAATDVCDQIKQDMDKLKEANKILRSQNVDLVQENMRLKAEVASRSPQKFGRYTVAALEAKCQLYERDVDHLKRALERSDQYIDELESRLRKCENRNPEGHEACGTAADALTQQQRLNMMMRSLSDEERRLICSNPEAESQTFAKNSSVLFMSSGTPKESKKSLTGERKKENPESISSDFSPATPSSAFQSLTLRSPGIREKKVTFKPVSYQKRLDFEELSGSGKMSSALESKFASLEKFPRGSSSNITGSPKSVFWGCWERPHANNPSCSGPSKESPVKESPSAGPAGDESDSFQMACEASMDAAYLDKISELDSMMLDGESSSSRGSHLSLGSPPPADLDRTLVAESQTCTDVPSSGGTCPAGEHKNLDSRDVKDETKTVKEASTSSVEDAFDSQTSSRNGARNVSISSERGWPSQNEELSFDLLFDATDDIKAGPSGSFSPVSQHQDLDLAYNPPSSTGEKPVSSRDKHALNGSQPIKRKSHSPFNTNSPTKLSKLM
ncbi:RING finger protein 219 [Oryzias melastigma]|uniref:RING finger protein 219 n=1 Tax=Oryzias melastigma TaxID=30732 RepID=A0A834FBS7_ORYME|nr:RING finger protein 219 [Oryzias melastigma]